MRVLHALEAFLRLSENWIYPQVTQVPGVDPAVVCTYRENAELFPLESAPLFPDPPPWGESLGVPRLINSMAFRTGNGGVVARSRASKWAPDLIHAHFGQRGWDMLHWKRLLNIPLITSFYGVDAWMLPRSGDFWRERLAELFREADLFLAEGPAMAARLEEVGAPAAKVRVIRLGVNVSRISFHARDFVPPLRVVMMARFVEKKGLADGLRACGEARRRGAAIDVTIIGDSTDAQGAAIKAELHSVADSEPLRGHVAFTGFLNPAAAHEILRDSHIFLCPSKHAADGDAEGGSPLSLTEAMASGLLCIGTNHCDIPELIRDGETGFLRESADIDPLADALLTACDTTADLPRLCRNGRALIEARFDTSHQVRELARAYAFVLGRNEENRAVAAIG